MPERNTSKTLRLEIIDLLTRWHPSTVAELMLMLREKRGIEAKTPEVAAVLSELQYEMGLNLQPKDPDPGNFLNFATALNINADFWAIVAGLAALAVVVSFPRAVFFEPLRWGLGSLAVLLFPGYSMQMGLFPRRKDMLLWKRMVLAIGLSIVSIGFYTTILDLTPNGINFESVSILLSIHAFIFAWIGLLRRFEAQQERV